MHSLVSWCIRAGYRHEEGGWFGFNNLIKWSTPSSGEFGEKKNIEMNIECFSKRLTSVLIIPSG